RLRRATDHPGRRPGRHHAPHARRPSRALARARRPEHPDAVRAVPLHAIARHAHHPSHRRGAVEGAGPLMPAPRTAHAGTIEQLLAAKEIVISCGSGGVGKTTTAAAAATMAAVKHDGKVLVLTVDPAK